jgi:hypothetical protein
MNSKEPVEEIEGLLRQLCADTRALTECNRELCATFRGFNESVERLIEVERTKNYRDWISVILTVAGVGIALLGLFL